MVIAHRGASSYAPENTLAAFDLAIQMGVGHLELDLKLEELSFPMLCLGASGLMNAVGNLAPAMVAALYDAVARGDLLGARALHYELFELNTAVFYDTNPVPIKWMMHRMGLLPSDEHRLPMVAADEALQSRLEPVLQRAGLI